MVIDVDQLGPAEVAQRIVDALGTATPTKAE